MIGASLNELATQFDAFLIDQFGVLLDGNGAYEYAPRALSRLAEWRKPILLVSNSGKRSSLNEARLTRLGFERSSYQAVLSSGEVAHIMLSRRVGVSINAGAQVWVHGRDNDISPVAGLDLTITEQPDDAEFIVLAGSRGDELTLNEYASMLRAAAKQGAVCLCTNPDFEMLTPAGRRFGAGRIAQLYEEMGGPVEWIGKPYPAIYAEAKRRLAGIAADRILCFGDSFDHDIAGGRQAGHATALVRTGLQADLSTDELGRACADTAAKPDFIVAKFDFAPE